MASEEWPPLGGLPGQLARWWKGCSAKQSSGSTILMAHAVHLFCNVPLTGEFSSAHHDGQARYRCLLRPAGVKRQICSHA
jgi:hypothetical protein